MAVSVTFRVEGLRELGEKMRKVGGKGALSICAAMTSAGAQVVKRRAVRNVVQQQAVDTGSLRDAIIVKKVPKSQTEFTSEHIVTVRGRGKRIKKSGAKKKQTIAPYANLVEFTYEYGTTVVPARPFLRPAIDEGKDEALTKMIQRGSARLNAVAK